MRKASFDQLHGSFESCLGRDYEMNVFGHENEGMQAECFLSFVVIKSF